MGVPTMPRMVSTATRQVSPTFTDLPLAELADVALQTASDLGATHADFRLERLKSQSLLLRNTDIESQADTETLGFAVRVVHGGAWGFAASVELTADEVARVAATAVMVARTTATMVDEPVVLAPEAPHVDVSWVSSYAVDPFDIAATDKAARLADLSSVMLASDHVQFTQGHLLQVMENKFYADLGGTRTTQQRVRLQCQLEAIKVSADGTFDSMRTIAPPVGRGWEWMVDGPKAGQWDWDGEVERIPELLREKAAAPSVEAGSYDLVIDPSNLWLTIHESIGHATELDRALGYEAAYAGTSFATIDNLNRLQYGSPVMNVTGDRIAEHGLSTIGWDDEGVRTTQWDIIKDGMLTGYQLDRRMAAQQGAVLGVHGSNGCAFADSPLHVPVQRMANVSLQPEPDGPDTNELIAGVENGIYVVGDKSWSIDMQRYNFQFTGQRFYAIRNGELAGQVRDVAYQATTTDFWRSMDAVGGPQTYVLGGAFNCGKAQPGQVAAVSHGCPSARFRNVNVLNAVKEGGQ
jgi:TldD protein